MINTLITTDIHAALGDLAPALRGLWADVAQEQGTSLDFKDITSYVKPDLFAKRNRGAILRRTFNQPLPNGDVIKFWRVTGPANHRNIDSDLSIEGLKEWGIIS